MKHQNLALITAMFALSACGAPQYSTAKLKSEVNALSKVYHLIFYLNQNLPKLYPVTLRMIFQKS